MTEAKHTPGPWTFQASESGDVIWIGNENENAACVPGFSDHPGNVANARLIAAAPDMLDEMRRILPVIERMEAAPVLWDEVTKGTGISTANGFRRAIAKAAGGQ